MFEKEKIKVSFSQNAWFDMVSPVKIITYPTIVLFQMRVILSTDYCLLLIHVLHKYNSFWMTILLSQKKELQTTTKLKIYQGTALVFSVTNLNQFKRSKRSFAVLESYIWAKTYRSKKKESKVLIFSDIYRTGADKLILPAKSRVRFFRWKLPPGNLWVAF